MSRGLLYWILVILWAVSMIGVRVVDNWPAWTNGAMFLLLFILIGWQVFGAPIKDSGRE